ncbi:rhomboid family intramembrane serine protease [Halobacteriales archaeon QS_3_64_16]|nr:MAG: rhomboid family intramembrane serine protease [Halobacteriales archaeon QS_3_64_16]
MGRLARSPTVETLALIAIVFSLQQFAGLVGSFVGLGGFGIAFFALGPPLAVAPWTLVTSVYAHASLAHLLSNAFALVVVGLVVETVTTRARFHLFFLLTGVLAGLTQVLVGGFVGSPAGVLGASGAILALVGYVLAANPLSETILDRLRLRRRAQLGVFVALALLVTFVTGTAGAALVAHFTGLLLGLLAGRLEVLHTDGDDGSSGPRRPETSAERL